MSDAALPAPPPSAPQPAARRAAPRRAPPPEAGWQAAFAMHARVVGAVVMRDLQTRFGSSYFGFLLGIIFPIGHFSIVIGIYLSLGRATPIGTDLFSFVTTGVLPFIIWLYSHRQVMLCLLHNRPLLSFPGTSIIDIMFGRCLVEFCTSSCISTAILIFLFSWHPNILIYNIPFFTISLFTAFLLGVSTGMTFAILSALWGPFLIVGNLLIAFSWATSGLLFVPDQLPNGVRTVLRFLPLPHIIDATRLAFFGEYNSDFFSPGILSSYILGLLVLSLAAQKLLRQHL